MDQIAWLGLKIDALLQLLIRLFKFNRLIELINFLKLMIKLHKYEYILFSPGGESFDAYKNYLDRGNHFNQLIKKVLF